MPRYHPPYLDKRVTIRNPEDRPEDEERDRRGNITNPTSWGQTVSANKRDQAPFTETPEGVEIKAGRTVFTIRKRAVAPNAEVIYKDTSYEMIGAPVERGGIMGEIWDEYLELHCERRSAQVGRMNYDRLSAREFLIERITKKLRAYNPDFDIVADPVNMIEAYDDNDNPDVHPVIEPGNVHQTRGPQASELGGVQLPSIIWGYDDEEHDIMIDGISDSVIRYFNVECRAATAIAAFDLANDVLVRIEPRLAEKLASYDVGDDRDLQRGDYFAHVVEVGINE